MLISCWAMGERLLRVQCKLGVQIGGDVVKCLVPVTSRLGRRDGGYLRHQLWHESEIDAIGVYCESTAASATCIPLLRSPGVRSSMHPPPAPAKNRQRRRITMGGAVRLGAIAQLGERVAGSTKVAGSSPASSIASRAT